MDAFGDLSDDTTARFADDFLLNLADAESGRGGECLNFADDGSRERRTSEAPHPIEQEKQLKYASLVANTIMLSNVADMAEVLSSMARDGHRVTPGLVACLSPYMGPVAKFF